MNATRTGLRGAGLGLACVVLASLPALGQQAIPACVGSTDLFAGAVEIEGSFAYIGWGAGLDVLEVSDPHQPALLTSLGGFEANITAIEVASSFAYVTIQDQGLQILDLSVPAAPVPLGFFSTPGAARDVVLSGTLAYVADGYHGLQIIDVSRPTAPILQGSYDTPRFAHAVALCASLAYVADGATLQILDVADSARPAFLGSYPATAVSVAVSSPLAYLSDGTGLQILDVSDPSAPDEVGSFYPSLNAFDRVAVSGSLACLATSLDLSSARAEDGLLMVDVSSPAQPILLGSFETSNVQDMVLSGPRLYLAAGTRGLLVLESPSPPAPETPSPTSTPSALPTPSPSPTPTVTPIPPPPLSDLNEDGRVDAEDLLLLMRSWHRSVTPLPLPAP